ncbi:hypothetical protein VQH23_26515 (plasmid) [Pararoseomonas sp. SCSIO 73927]|uniref:hypothetical protein n=1 Tax=Pararoseomonas sp. SCSIO 73927 TaxID=3114537 RepID=UPI0030CB743B
MSVLAALAYPIAMLAAWAALIAAAGWASGRVRVVVPCPTVSPRRLAAVVEDMRRLGPPRLRGMRSGGAWLLVEGSHRVEAARVLGLPITVEEIGPEAPCWGHDWPEIEGDARRRDGAPAGALLESATRWREVSVPARRVWARRLRWPGVLPGWLAV